MSTALSSGSRRLCAGQMLLSADTISPGAHAQLGRQRRVLQWAR